jgi:hypothetical protein
MQDKSTHAYLWSLGFPWNMYDAATGQLELTFPGSPMPGGFGSSTPVVLSEVYPSSGGGAEGGAAGGGALLVYISGVTTDQKSTWVACWNSTKAVTTFDNNGVMWMNYYSETNMISPMMPGTQIPWAL